MPKFDPGYVAQPFIGLVEDYPDAQVYPFDAFRVEWGPIFHRGRLDGSARVLAIGQDPAQHETAARRVLVGEAGHRVQGFLAKLGIDRSYVIINTFVYSAFNQPKAAAHVSDPKLVDYRNKWLDALLVGTQVEAVIAFGNLADTAFQDWKVTPNGAASTVKFQKVIHPTAPRNAADLANMLNNWNTGLQNLKPVIQNPDVVRPLVLYGASFAAGERPGIPEEDMPAGIPDWMRTDDGWAKRVGDTVSLKRRTIVVTVPSGIVP